ncbi:MAG: LamG-like jellyroll fold domain-containing protein [Candidatus Magasanikbacteria bacterium]
MRKISLKLISLLFLSVIVIGGAVLLFPFVSAAQPADSSAITTGDLGINYGAYTGLSEGDIRITIANIIRAFLGLLGIIVVGLLIYAGYTWMTAGGDDEKINQAKKIIRNAAIGLVLILSAYAITSFVMTRLLAAQSGYLPHCYNTACDGDEACLSNSGLPINCGGSCAPCTVSGGDYNYLYLLSTTKGDVCIRNVAPLLVFNRGVDIDSLNDNVKIYNHENKIVEGKWSAGESSEVAKFVPSATCPSPNAGLYCLEANATYTIKFVNSSQIKSSYGNLSLRCSDSHPCNNSEFRTGGSVDIQNPSVEITNIRIDTDDFLVPPWSGLTNSNVIVTVSSSDETAVQNSMFYARGYLVSSTNFSGCQKQVTTDFIWDTNTWRAGKYDVRSVVYDYAAHFGQHATSTVLYPAHCYNYLIEDGTNSTINLGEKRNIMPGGPPQCGGECGGCDGDPCGSDGDCSSGMSCVAGVCATKMQITNFSPASTTPGSFVSIFGYFFGDEPGRVYFAKTTSSPNPINTSTEWVEASIANCGSGFDNWLPWQIIVELPASATSGAIMVETASTSVKATQTDTTKDSWGPSLKDFGVVQGEVNPSLCGIRPEAGWPSDWTTSTGKSFGVKTGASKLVFGIGKNASVNNWTNSSIIAKVPATVNEGRVGVKAVRGDGVNSNSVLFLVKPGTRADTPFIESISPPEGARGEYITITGKNFGNSIGQVRFWDTQESQLVSGDFSSFPTECSSDKIWTDTQIIVKFPSSAEHGFLNNHYQVQVITAKNKFNELDLEKIFTLRDGLPKPGICAITPAIGPIPFNGSSTMKIVGEYFLLGENQEVSSGLSAWWTFDDTNTEGGKITVNDSSGNNNTAILRPLGGLSNLLGENKVLGLLGGNIFLPTSGSFYLNNNFSYSLWVNSSFINSATLLQMRERSHLYVETGTGVPYVAYAYFYQDPSTTTEHLLARELGSPITTAIATGTWALVTVAKDSNSGVRIYINGELKASDSRYKENIVLLPGAAVGAGFDTCVDGNPENCTMNGRFPMSVDDVRIYSRSLTSFEVKYLYNTTKPLGGNSTAVDSTDAYFWRVGAVAGKNAVEGRLAAAHDLSYDLQKIGTVFKLNVVPPVSTQTGPVVIQRTIDGKISNHINFTKWDCVEAGKNLKLPGGYCTVEDTHCCTTGADVGFCKNQCDGELVSAGYLWRFCTQDIPELPYVIERCNNDTENGIGLPTPSPATMWNNFSNGDASNVCRGAAITVEFSTLMNPDDLATTTGSYHKNVRVYECPASGCNKLSEMNQVTSTNLVFQVAAGKGVAVSTTCMVSNNYLYITNKNGWKDNQNYQVILMGGDSGIHKLPNWQYDGCGSTSTPALFASRPCNNLVPGSAYCFDFRTDNRQCGLRQVVVTPYRYWTTYLEKIISYHFYNQPPMPVYYFGRGLSDQRCIMMDMSGYNWSWQSSSTEYAGISGPLYGEQTTVSSSANTVNIGLTNPDDAVNINATAATSSIVTTTNPLGVLEGGLVESRKTGQSPLTIDLSHPKVVDYWPRCQEVCPEAEVGARFNITMSDWNVKDGSSFVAAVQQSVQLFKCVDENCSSTQSVYLAQGGGGDNGEIHFKSNAVPAHTVLNIYNNLNNSLPLATNTVYKVVISAKVSESMVSSSDQVLWGAKNSNFSQRGWPYNEQFVWRFKTKATRCLIDRVAVEPTIYWANFVNDRQLFSAQPYSTPDSCNTYGQRLNPWSQSWNWESSTTSVATVSTFSTKGSNPNCTSNCLRKGSTIPAGAKLNFALCGNGILEAGEDCDIGKKDENNNLVETGSSCTLNCLRPGNFIASSTLVVSTTQLLDFGVCGDGVVSTTIGEECDPKAVAGVDSQGCSSVCRHTGSGNTANPADPDQSICGNGMVGWGEECDLAIGSDVNNFKSSLNCSPSCIHLGSQIDITWCSNHWSDHQALGYPDSTFIAACNTKVSVCGDTQLSADEDEGCDGAGGWNQSACNRWCLKNKGDSSSDNVIVNNCASNPMPAGCDSSRSHNGSSLDYSIPSVCGDGIVGLGEDATCENTSQFVNTRANWTDSNGSHVWIDPWALAIGVGLDTNPIYFSDRLYQITNIKASTNMNTPSSSVVTGENYRVDGEIKSGVGKFVIPCGYTSDEECKQFGDDYALSENSCCYPRPKLTNVYPGGTAVIGHYLNPGTDLPLNPPAVMEDVCPNTLIEAKFNQVINPTTLSGNVILARGVGNDNPAFVHSAYFTSSSVSFGYVTAANTFKKIQIVGNFAYVRDGSNSGVKIIDIINPLRPVIASVLNKDPDDNPLPKEDFYVDSNRLYMVGGTVGVLKVYDVSNPYYPAFLGSIGSGYNVLLPKPKVVVGKGDYVYVASYNSCSGTNIVPPVEVFDMSKLPAITKVGYYYTQATTTPGCLWPSKMLIDGSYLYILWGGNTLEMVDISNPTAPKLVKLFKNGDGIVPSARIYDFDVNDGKLYIANVDVSGMSNGIVVVDVASGVPALLKVLPVSNEPGKVAVKGNRLFVYSTGLNVLDIYNVVNPASPTFVTSYPIDKGGVNTNAVESLAVDNNYVYFSGKLINSVDRRFNALSISSIFNFQTASGITSPTKIFVADNYAYILDYSQNLRLEIFDVNDQYNPVYLGAVTSNTTATIKKSGGLWVKDNLVYVASNDTFWVIDAANKNTPVIIGSYTSTTLFGNPMGIAVKGQYAYIVDNQTKALVIMDISSSTAPTPIGTLNYIDFGEVKLENPQSIIVSGNYAFIGLNAGEEDGGLEIVDISDPTNPTHYLYYVDPKGRLASNVRALAIKGQTLFAVDNTLKNGSGFNGLLAIDISNPAAPKFLSEVGGIDFAGANGVFVQGGYAFVTVLDSDKLLAIDISNPAKLTIRQPIVAANGVGGVTLNDPRGIFIKNDVAYIAVANGVEMLDIKQFNNTGCAGGTDVTKLIADAYFSPEYQNLPWYKQLWNRLANFVKRILGIDEAMAVVRPQPLRWCAGLDQITTDIYNYPNSNGSAIQIHLSKPLNFSTDYAVILKDGVRDARSISIGTVSSSQGIKPIYWRFITDKSICEVDKVTVAPPVTSFQKSGATSTLMAIVSDNKSRIIQALPGYYDWENWWGPQNNSYVKLANTTSSINQIESKNQNGEIDVRDSVIVTKNLYSSNIGIRATGYGHVVVFLCENPWPPIGEPLNIFPYEDKLGNNDYFDVSSSVFTGAAIVPAEQGGGYYNFRAYYCMDNGVAGNTNDDLPALYPIVQVSSTVRTSLAEPTIQTFAQAESSQRALASVDDNYLSAVSKTSGFFGGLVSLLVDNRLVKKLLSPDSEVALAADVIKSDKYCTNINPDGSGFSQLETWRCTQDSECPVRFYAGAWDGVGYNVINPGSKKHLCERVILGVWSVYTKYENDIYRAYACDAVSDCSDVPLAADFKRCNTEVVYNTNQYSCQIKPSCGDGIQAGAEQCDLGDANGSAGTGCASDCSFAAVTCGDGICASGLENAQDCPMDCSSAYLNGAWKRFLFPNNKNNDIIGIQIFPNSNHLTARQWYSNIKELGGREFTGAMQDLEIKGYNAVSDGNNVYVDVLNYSTTTKSVYSLIYLFSINSDAQAVTRKIFDQIITNIEFNINLYNDKYCVENPGQPPTASLDIPCVSDMDCDTTRYTCAVQADKIKRNFKRLRALNQTQTALEDINNQGTVSPSNAMAWWQFDETFASGTDSNVRLFPDYLGQLIGSCDDSGDACPTMISTGHNKNALSFDGVNDSIIINDKNSLDSPKFSVEAWVNPNGVQSSWARILSQENDARSEFAKSFQSFDLEFNDQNSVRLNVFGTPSSLTVDSAVTVTPGKWNHIVATFDGSVAKLYVNGSLPAVNSVENLVINTNTQNLVIGRALQPGNYYYKGQMDDVIYYQRVLSASEVATRFSGSGSKYPDLKEGTFLTGQTISTWPSWSVLGNALGVNVAVDPINRLGTAGTCSSSTNKFCNSADPAFSACPIGETCIIHDAETGWSTVGRRFSYACAPDSLAYRYIYATSTGYQMRFRMENPGLQITNWNNFVEDFVDVDRFSDAAVDSAYGICTGAEEISTIQKGYCGDGKVNIGQEACDPPGSKIEDRSGCILGVGEIEIKTCNNFCQWSAITTSSCGGQVVNTCGNGILELWAGEACDDGKLLNGSYNHCNDFCSAKVSAWPLGPGFCGDATTTPGKELCDIAEIMTGTTVSVTSGVRYSLDKNKSCGWDCQRVGPYCGDSITQGEFGEECDGNESCITADGLSGVKVCDNNCLQLPRSATCIGGSNDGTNLLGGVNPEVCKSGGGTDKPVNWFCSSTQSAVAVATCGNGIVEPNVGEACDQKDKNGVACSASYNVACQYCSSDCTNWIEVKPIQYCGNGILEADEMCDYTTDGKIYVSGKFSSSTELVGAYSTSNKGYILKDCSDQPSSVNGGATSISSLTPRKGGDVKKCINQCKSVNQNCVTCGVNRLYGKQLEILAVNPLCAGNPITGCLPIAADPTYKDRTLNLFFAKNSNAIYGNDPNSGDGSVYHVAAGKAEGTSAGGGTRRYRFYEFNNLPVQAGSTVSGFVVTSKLAELITNTLCSRSGIVSNEEQRYQLAVTDDPFSGLWNSTFNNYDPKDRIDINFTGDADSDDNDLFLSPILSKNDAEDGSFVVHTGHKPDTTHMRSQIRVVLSWRNLSSLFTFNPTLGFYDGSQYQELGLSALPAVLNTLTNSYNYLSTSFSSDIFPVWKHSSSCFEEPHRCWQSFTIDLSDSNNSDNILGLYVRGAIISKEGEAISGIADQVILQQSNPRVDIYIPQAGNRYYFSRPAISYYLKDAVASANASAHYWHVLNFKRITKLQTATLDNAVSSTNKVITCRPQIFGAPCE